MKLKKDLSNWRQYAEELRKEAKKARRERIMKIYERYTAYIRTYSPIVAAYIISLLADIGLDISEGEQYLIGLIGVFGGAIYYAVARLLGKKWPQVEKWLLGSSKQPSYNK